MKNIRLCPVCKCKISNYVTKITLGIPHEIADDISYPDSYNVLQCNNCGMIYADVSLTKDDVEKYYMNCNIYDNISLIKKNVYDEHYSQVLQKLNDISKDANIIDVGCGNGALLNLLKQRGYKNLCGLDPSESSVKYILDNYNIDCILGSVYNLSDNLYEKYDLVIFSGVLEHVLYPDECINNLKKLLKPDGILFLAMPNAQGFGEYICDVPNYFNFEHINYFTPNTLDTLCRKNNLSRISPDEWLKEVTLTQPCELIMSAMYKVDENLNISDFVCDQTGKESVLKFIKETEVKRIALNNKIEDIIKENDSVIMWGSGSFSGTLFAQYPELKTKVLWIVDNNSKRWGQTFWDKEIKSPQSLLDNMDIPIMLCIMLNNNEVVEQMKGMGLKNKVYIMTV